ncbi:MAG: phosphopantetheine-binding protein [Planctomycetota bacterium]
MSADPAAAVVSALRTVLIDTGRADREIAPPMLLGADLGLDSLDVAQAVVLLERALGVDPFRSGASGGPVRAVGDLITIYTAALEPSVRQDP